MEVTKDVFNEFAKLLIMRGFGLYGDQKMIKICEESGLTCNTDGSFYLVTDENIDLITRKLIINYAKFNLPAKMTTLVLAKKYNIPIPEELKSTLKRKSKYRMKLDS